MKTFGTFALSLAFAVIVATVIAGCSGPGQFSASAVVVEYEEHDFYDGDVEVRGGIEINGRRTTGCVDRYSGELVTKPVAISGIGPDNDFNVSESGQFFERPILIKYFCENAERIAEKVYYLPCLELKEERYFKDNKKEGVWKSYYESGELRHEVFYKNGVMEGIVKGYHKNGKTAFEFFYRAFCKTFPPNSD